MACELHMSDMRMACVYITNDIWVHMIHIRVTDTSDIRVTWEWYTIKYECHTSDIRMVYE